MNDEIYRLWLSTLHSIGSRKQNALLEYYGTAREIYNTPMKELNNLTWLTSHNIHILTSLRNLDTIKAMQEKMNTSQIRYISREHIGFPEQLSLIPDSPVGVFIIGELPDAKHFAALIGSRRCSEYGLSATRLLAKPLARRGVVIVSGMARGIDSMAHKSAIEGGGKTIAVLGCGADICYPSENRGLREDIIKNGCIISEYPPGTDPLPSYFPARNRIISGLSSVVVVIEAAKKSGTLITVDQANDQGREVMAVPGNITSKMSEGTNILIREGATPAISHEDVLDVLGIPLEPEAEQLALPEANALAPDEKVVYDSLTFDPMSFDDLVRKSGLQPQAIHYVGTLLEVKGYIKKLPGMRFIRNVR